MRGIPIRDDISLDDSSDNPSSDRISESGDEIEEMIKTKQKADWQILRNTISKNDKFAETTMNFQEKAENLSQKQDELLHKHFRYIREVANLLREEGQVLTRVKT